MTGIQQSSTVSWNGLTVGVCLEDFIWHCTEKFYLLFSGMDLIVLWLHRSEHGIDWNFRKYNVDITILGKDS